MKQRRIQIKLYADDGKKEGHIEILLPAGIQFGPAKGLFDHLVDEAKVWFVLESGKSEASP